MQKRRTGKGPLLWLAGGAVVLLGGIAWARAATRGGCSVLFLSDTHGRFGGEALLRRMLAERGIAAVLHAGDFADSPDLWGPWWDTPYREVRTAWPLIAATGNHDVATSENAAAFRSRFPTVPRWVKVCDGSVAVFVLGWPVTQEQVEWLTGAVRTSFNPDHAGVRTRILLTHRPVWEPDGGGLAARFPGLAAPLASIDLVLAGHGHISWDSSHAVGGRTVLQATTVTGPKFYDCDGTANCASGRSEYLRVDLGGDRITVTRRTA